MRKGSTVVMTVGSVGHALAPTVCTVSGRPKSMISGVTEVLLVAGALVAQVFCWSSTTPGALVEVVPSKPMSNPHRRQDWLARGLMPAMVRAVEDVLMAETPPNGRPVSTTAW